MKSIKPTLHRKMLITICLSPVAISKLREKSLQKKMPLSRVVEELVSGDKNEK
jgi:hypothetical protein